MSLSGNLGFVSIDEILRLLDRSNQQGAIDVRGDGFSGRIFIGTAGIDLATTSDDNSLRRHLVQSGLVDEIYMTAIEAGDESFAKLAEQNGDEIVELLREMTVESLYQMARLGSDFEVFEGQTTAFASPVAFELESVLSDAAKRVDDWESVSRAVPDLAAKLLFERDLGDRDEVNVGADAWKVLSEIGSGSSVEEIAEKLGTTEFWTARVAGHLLGDSLIASTVTDKDETPAETEEQAAGSDGSGEVSFDEAEWEQKSAGWRSDVASTPPSEESATDVADDDDVDPDQSWWQEPSDDEESAAADTEPASADGDAKSDGSMFGKFAPGPTTETEDSTDPEAEESQIPTVAAPEATEATEVEEDTEAFLEKVFSELESSDETGDDDAGYGLLRGRGMGVAKDATPDA